MTLLKAISRCCGERECCARRQEALNAKETEEYHWKERQGNDYEGQGGCPGKRI